MPYINAETRAELAPELNALKQGIEHLGAGALNYMITQLLIAWMGKTPTYFAFNSVIGVLRCVELELYRRMVAPYEDVKRGDNGDVYPPSEAEKRLQEAFPDPKGDTPHERE